MAHGVYDEQVIVIAENMAMNVDAFTTYHDVHGFDCGSMVINWTGANSTSAQLVPQFSIDGDCWCNFVADTGAQKVDGATGCKMYEFPQFCFKYVRLKFVKKSNSAGTMTVKSYAKRYWHNR